MTKQTYTATLETNMQTTEQATFKNYSRTNFDPFDNTDAGTTYTYAQLLNGGVNGQVGLAKGLSVMPGDTITAQVYAKYLSISGTASNYTGFIAALTSAFGFTSSMTGEAAQAYSALSAQAAPVASGTGHSNTGSAPKAFITVPFLVFFTNNHVLRCLIFLTSRQLSVLFLNANYKLQDVPSGIP